MSNLQNVKIDILRTVSHTSISGSYVAVGGPFTFRVRLICITNNTDGDMFFSDDRINNKLFVPASSFKLFDATTNTIQTQKEWLFPIGTQFYVIESTAPTKGDVYIEALGAQ